MSIFDYEEAPPPPPRYQAKVVKDKSLKDEVQYELQFFYELNNEWLGIYSSKTKQNTKFQKRKFEERDKRYGEVHKYRIVRLTIKKEVVK